jgi:hypothetical protein
MTLTCASCSSALDEGYLVCPRCGIAAPEYPPKADEPAAAAVPSFLPFEDLDGIGGWLILPAIGLVVSPFVILHALFTANIPILFGDKYQPFLNSHPAFTGLLIFEVITNIVLIAALAGLNYLFFTKRKSLPTYMILYFATQLLVVLADGITAHALFPNGKLETAYTAIARSFVACLIWIPYFLVSRRVKATFTR